MIRAVLLALLLGGGLLLATGSARAADAPHGQASTSVASTSAQQRAGSSRTTSWPNGSPAASALWLGAGTAGLLVGVAALSVARRREARTVAA
jgi:hypothetical protein